jgi:5-methylcytosine-specific restriction protein B
MVAIPLEQAIREFDRSAVAPLVAAAEQQRQEVLRRFPREEWPTMAIERYAVGLSGHRDTFCRLLEFQTTDLGSIKGGSSRVSIQVLADPRPLAGTMGSTSSSACIVGER